MDPRDEDMGAQIRHWLENRKPTAQALVRCLTREEVEDRIPDTLQPYIEVETHDDLVLVKAGEVPGAVALVQRIASEDAERVHALQADHEVGSGDGDDGALDAG